MKFIPVGENSRVTVKTHDINAMLPNISSTHRRDAAKMLQFEVITRRNAINALKSNMDDLNAECRERALRTIQNLRKQLQEMEITE